jgi:DNA repair ATPase RecN
MAERARVTSLEAIESFRAALVIYREKAGRVLDEVSDEVIRTRMWLQSDRITFWQNQVREKDRKLKEKQQELFSAQMSGLRDSSVMQQMAVQKAKEALREAEARLQLVKQWNRQYDQRVEPLAHQVEKFRHEVGQNLGKAIIWMAELHKTLANYAELSPTTADMPPPTDASDSTSTSAQGEEIKS